MCSTSDILDIYLYNKLPEFTYLEKIRKKLIIFNLIFSRFTTKINLRLISKVVEN
jgi:hypothetical protein